MREVKKFIPENPQTVEGFWKSSFNFDGTVLQVIVNPASSDTIYNFGIKDEDGMVVFLRTDVKGNLIVDGLDLVVFYGEKNLIIEDASKDEPFSIKIIYQL
jgi:hypothetical protein